jgi:hypothetical protein
MFQAWEKGRALQNGTKSVMWVGVLIVLKTTTKTELLERGGVPTFESKTSLPTEGHANEAGLKYLYIYIL